MMKKLAVLILCLQQVAFGAITIINQNLSTTSTTIPATTAGDGFVIIVDSSTAGSAMSVTGGDAMTKKLCSPTSIGLQDCVWYIKNMASGAHTAFTCTGCGTINHFTWFEVRGQDTTTFLDKVVPCNEPAVTCNQQGTDGTTTNRLFYTPGYSSEAVMYASPCQLTGTTFTGTGATWSSSLAAGGNPGASAITAGFGSVSGSVDSSCGGTNGLILGVIAAGASQQCSWDTGYFDYGAQATTGNATVAANLEQAGNLVIAAGFVVNGFTSVATNIAATDNMTQGFAGTSSADTGQVFIDYMLGNTVTGGSKTITAAVTGTHSAVQVGYDEFIPSANCTMAFDAASSVGTGTGATATTPSITGSAGDLLFMYTSPGAGVHVSYTNSPWVCNVFALAGETQDCTYVNSRSAFGYVLSATGSPTANAMLLTTGTWQAGAIAISLTPTNPPPPSGGGMLCNGLSLYLCPGRQ